MCQIIRARSVELYDIHGLRAFQLPGVQQAIDLLLDAGEGRAACRSLEYDDRQLYDRRRQPQLANCEPHWHGGHYLAGDHERGNVERSGGQRLPRSDHGT